MVLVVSFVALAVLWPEPQPAEAQPGGRCPAGSAGCSPAGRWRSSAARSASSCSGCTSTRGCAARRAPTANFAPTFVYVIFWLALVPLSVLFGDVFRAFNPWRAIGRAVAWVARTASRSELPAPLDYPDWLGHWPAAVGIFAFATLELVASNGDKPDTSPSRRSSTRRSPSWRWRSMESTAGSIAARPSPSTSTCSRACLCSRRATARWASARRCRACRSSSRCRAPWRCSR